MNFAGEATLDPRDVNREQARRRLALRHLIPFAEYIWKGYSTQPAHKLIALKLHEVELYVRTRGRQGIPRLIIEMPPRHGKTELVSKIFPAWFLGKNTDRRVILASHTAALAEDNSRKVREYMSSPEYARLF